jgi:hypothetical protein
MAGAGIAGGRYLQAHKAHWVLRKERVYMYVQFFGYMFSVQNTNKTPLILSAQEETKEKSMKE